MIDLICTQRINPGAATRVEELLSEAEQLTLTNDEGCDRYEWYRGNQPDTYVLIERWRDRDAAQSTSMHPTWFASSASWKSLCRKDSRSPGW